MRWFRSPGQAVREKQLDAELQFHIDQRTADNISAGMSPQEARRRALMEFEGIERVKEECRDVQWSTRFESVYHDFLFAIRNLRKDRRYAGLAALALALGIGARRLRTLPCPLARC